MSVRQLPSGSLQARLTIEGVNYAATFATEREAHDWVVVTREQAITGRLPKRISVREYAARWMATYDAAPTSTRNFHQGSLDRHILPGLGARSMAEVTPTDISSMLNNVRLSVSAACADAVYRTCSDREALTRKRGRPAPTRTRCDPAMRCTLLACAARDPHQLLQAIRATDHHGYGPGQPVIFEVAAAVT